MRNLAPGIHRQRMVIEFTTASPVTAGQARKFAVALERAMGMNILDLDISDRCPLGIAVMCHWDYSGWSLMGWDQPDGTWFGTIDLHSCKPFAYETAIGVIQREFTPAALEWAPVLPELTAAVLA